MENRDWSGDDRRAAADDQRWDSEHVWHPYAPLPSPYPARFVDSAHGAVLQLRDHGPVVDAMASWWSAIHGYGEPTITAAMHDQLDRMSHVMFGGLTHDPAVQLTRRLAALAPGDLDRVFVADSGSVAVEVAMKMAVQHWAGRGQPAKTGFLALRGGYHGDTLGAMSCCDPDTGMHSRFGGSVPTQRFLPRPPASQEAVDDYLRTVEVTVREAADRTAALILEPIVQGAGGMWIYPPAVLRGLAELCTRHHILLVADEIATGFGRTGRMFACEWASVVPDIMCVGKALTGGFTSLAATITTAEVAAAVSASPMGALMHGPTFMANPLACAAANASLSLLEDGSWAERVSAVEAGLRAGLAPVARHASVADVRVLGAIGVVELTAPVPIPQVTAVALDHGVWLRPFDRLIYTLPPYVTSSEQVATICSAIDACAASVA